MTSAMVRPKGFGIVVRLYGPALEYLTEATVIELARAEASVDGYAIDPDAPPRTENVSSLRRNDTAMEVTFPRARR